MIFSVDTLGENFLTFMIWDSLPEYRIASFSIRQSWHLFEPGLKDDSTERILNLTLYSRLSFHNLRLLNVVSWLLCPNLKVVNAIPIYFLIAKIFYNYKYLSVCMSGLEGNAVTNSKNVKIQKHAFLVCYLR